MAEKEAPCPLLLAHTGVLLCDAPTKCYKCPYLQYEISQHPPGFVNWVCPACVTEVSRKAKEQGTLIQMPGLYVAGLCDYIGCTRPSRIELRDQDSFLPDSDEIPPEEDFIERLPGYSSLLQLIIGNIHPRRWFRK